MTEETYAAWEGASSFDALDAIDKQLFSGGYEMASVFVDYEAANAFGTPVKGLGHCEAKVREADDVRELKPETIRINGRTNFRFLMDQLAN